MAVNLATVTTLNRVRLYEGQPSTGVVTVYTVPSATDVAIRSIVLCNTTASTATVTLSAVPSGSTAGVTNQVLSALSVSANSTTTIDTNLYMTTGDFLAALQGTSGAVTMYVSGETYA